MRRPYLFLFVPIMFLTGCGAHRATVRSPYDEVRHGMTQMAERINDRTTPNGPFSREYGTVDPYTHAPTNSGTNGPFSREYASVSPYARTLTNYLGVPIRNVEPYSDPRWQFPCAQIRDLMTAYEVHIEEIPPGTIVTIHTTIHAEPARKGLTRISVLSKKTGIWFDSREHRLEKARLHELLSILEPNER